MLNEALRLIRVYHDLSQSELSSEMGISNSYLSELEAGKKQPTLDILSKYSKQFDIPTSSLLFFAEKMGENKPTDKLRQFAAGKVVSLLQWVEQKSSSSSGKKPLRRKNA